MNRFLQTDQRLKELDRRRAGACAPGNGGVAAMSRLQRGASARTRFARPFSASQRALVILIENGGIDLGIGTLVEKLLDAVPGSSFIPDSVKESFGKAIDKRIREATDNALEAIELGVNRYAAAKPDHYGEVVILRNATAAATNLRDTLVRLTAEEKFIDLFVLTHGRDEFIALNDGGGVSASDIRAIRTNNGNKPVRLRAVYMMNCEGSSLNQAWIDAGAKAACGSVHTNYLPEPTMFYFFRNWKAGQSFTDAATNAYRSSIETMKVLIRQAADTITGLPAGIGGMIAERVADLESRDFVKESAPRIDGDGSIMISSDSLAFSASMRAPTLAFTIVPISRSRSGPTPRTKTWEVSSAGIDFIKSYEKFMPNLYDDPAGRCTVGYGTLVHRGNCSGDASEASYTSGITEARATELLMERLNDFQSAVNDAVTTELTQSQYDALVSFTYNVGSGAFRGSTLLKKLNAGEYDAVPTELKKWVKANGKTLPGLVKRRDAEAAMFSSGTYSNNKSLRVRQFDQPRGLRNNNPGNLRISTQPWEGKVPNKDNTDGAFEQFTSYEYGVRALVLLLRNYVRSGRDTLRKIIAAYAPASDGNAPDDYVAFLVQRFRSNSVEVTPDSTLTANRATLCILAQGIGRMENGVECISEEQFNAGLALLAPDVRTSIGSSLSVTDYYRGMSEPSYETEEGELEDIMVGAVQMSGDLPDFCPVNPAEDASTEHFKLSEFDSKDGVETPRGARGNIQMVMDQLEVLRAEVGSSIQVISGYRSPAHNKKVEGKAKSQHMCGTAADIKIKGMTPTEVHAKIEELIGAKRMKQGGLGLYRTFVHYDIRGTKARW